MEFADTIYAASMFLLCYVLLFIPLHQVIGFATFVMPNSIIVAFLVSGLIVGAVFAKKIANHKAISIGKILLICSTIIVFFIFTSNVVDWTAYQEIYHSTWTAAQWSQQMVYMLYLTMGVYVTMGLGIVALGLYTGIKLVQIRNPP